MDEVKLSQLELPKPSRISLCLNHIGSVSPESNSASAKMSQYSTPQILRHFTSHQITIKRTVSLRKIDLGSSTDPLYAFDPEIEKTLRRLRKARNLVVNNSRSSDSVIDSNQLCIDNSVASSNIFAEPGQMEDNDKTLKELATPDVGISEDYIKMKAFPFSLDGAAKDWLYLQPVLFNTWGDMKRTFLEKFFPASRTASIRKEICGIRQHTGETLHEYWERFNKLCATCPHHQISEQLLIQYFYEGLSMMDRSMINAASGGALMDKTPTATRHLISNMASNTQQFGIRGLS
ncbi:hypothetical protein CR513_12440, partial [Mucuna pruriens]